MTADTASLDRRVPLPSRQKVSLFMQEYGILVALFALVLFVSLKSSAFFTENNLLNIADQMTVVGILAVGMTLLMVSGSLTSPSGRPSASAAP